MPPLKETIPAIALVFILGLSSPCLAQEFRPFEGVVKNNNINVRSDSTTASKIICTLNQGDRVYVVNESYGWYKIRLPKKAPSYVKKILLECLPEEKSPAPSTPKAENQHKICHAAKVTGNRVNIRLEPNQSSKILGMLNKNAVVNILGEDNGWYKIEPPEEGLAWINKQFVSKETPRATKPQESPKAEDNLPGLKQQRGEPLTAVQGSIQPYGRVFLRIATHKLITPEKKIFLLKGNKKELDSLIYRKVRISGKILSNAKEKYPVIEVSAIEVLN